MWMAKQSIIVGFILLPSFSGAFAGTYSTKWSIKNATTEAVSLRCKNISQSDMSISLHSQVIAAGATGVYDWGDDYYNDGMGLNPGTWACSAVNGDAKAFDLAPFSTAWGEAVDLKISGSKGGLVLSMSKAPNAAPEKASSRSSSPQLPTSKASRS